MGVGGTVAPVTLGMHANLKKKVDMATALISAMMLATKQDAHGGRTRKV
jgi:hypothetical protein